jgi:hypothetical protein
VRTDSVPVVGWRLWVLSRDQLRSWAVPYVWHPGENRAECLADRAPRCRYSPGTGCSCGFWALWTPSAVASRARTGSHDLVTGLAAGWGTVAIHGSEGFRAERARILCLFEDWLWDRHSRPSSVREAKWLSRGLRWLTSSHPLFSEPMDSQTVHNVAEAYGVPVLSLGEAFRKGVLSEFGISQAAIDELREWERVMA